jgi:AcrR family transcriptional regulator
VLHQEQESNRLRAVPQPVRRIGKAERTRAAILDAALEFIWSRPFRDMTVSSLMATTGLSRAAFYRYFKDLHEVTEALLEMLQGEILAAAEPWLAGAGDPVALLRQTLAGLVRVCYDRGPFLRAVTDAASTDERVEKAWTQFLASFDVAARARIEADQEQGLIPEFDASPVAFALNRLNAYTLIQAFGTRPRRQPKLIEDALARIWISTLYGSQHLAGDTSSLVRRSADGAL